MTADSGDGVVRETVSHSDDVVRDLEHDRLFRRTQEAGYY
jgi:hypothetical protein